MILLIVISSILFILLILSIFLALRVSRQNQTYEEFYSSTLDDFEGVRDMLEVLIHRRQMISDDPDIQRVREVVEILYNVVLGYMNNNGKTKKERKKE